jgi:hypothetical protein
MKKARTTMLAVRVIFERGLLLRFFQPIFACTEAFYLHRGLADHVNCCDHANTLKTLPGNLHRKRGRAFQTIR